jgi:catechol 2,3-dioxygenase-like lactoylglutathione lyase family enzyme
MAIRSVLINTADVERSVDFYTRYLDAVPSEVTADRAVLDLVTATLELRRIDASQTSSWKPDDLQDGFRHVGFKVGDLDARVASLLEAGVPFQLEPIHAEGDVRITFFYDPDGTLLEFVEGPLRYHEVYDERAVNEDWALGDPDRPRFDHVAETVDELAPTLEYYGELGFGLMGGIHQAADPRGFEINYLRSGDTSLEVFTFDAPHSHREVQDDAPGFAAMVLDDDRPAGVSSSRTPGRTLDGTGDGAVTVKLGR